jgi:glycosyltransferase involved in cell wall biosynthesis
MLIEGMETGVLVPTDDDVMLSRAIRTVLGDENLSQRIARKGYEAYRAKFTEEEVVKQYLSFFEDITG